MAYPTLAGKTMFVATTVNGDVSKSMLDALVSGN